MAKVVRNSTEGCTFFKGQEKVKGKNKGEFTLTPALFGVTSEKICKVNPKTKKTIKEWTFEQMKRWSFASGTFTFDFGDYESKYITFISEEGEAMSQLIQRYIDIKLKKIEGNKKAGQVVPNSQQPVLSTPTSASAQASPTQIAPAGSSRAHPPQNSFSSVSPELPDLEFLLLVSYNSNNYKISTKASSLKILQEKISEELGIPAGTQILINYHDDDFNIDVVARNISDVPKKGKITVTLSTPPPVPVVTKLRKENRFGSGLEQILGQAVEFYPPSYVPSRSILQVIESEGSFGVSILTKIELENNGVSELSKHEKCLLHMYTVESPFYAHLNKVMRENIPEDVEKLRDFIYYLNITLLKVPTFTGSVYRGINVQLSEYKVGMKVYWPAFSSSSSDAKVALEFMKGGSGTLFLIMSKNSHSIHKYSAIPKEAECLFQPNSVFQVSAEFNSASKKILESQLNINLENVKIFQLEEI